MYARTDLKAWIDFVRGLADPASARQLQQALESGDAQARRLEAVARSIQAGLQWRREIAVPANVLRRAEALAATVAVSKPSMTVILARMLFDSFATPLMAGVRGAVQPARHTTHRAGDYQLGLRMERHPATRQVSIIGQLTSENATPTGEFEVRALRAGRVIAQTASTEHGEFQFDLPSGSAVKLELDLRSPAVRIAVDMRNFGQANALSTSKAPKRAS